MSIEKTATRDVVRVVNKHLVNPAMLRVAGRKHVFASVIHHTGRHSGKAYRTPVVADRVVDGFVVPLPYGTDIDWLQNLEAGGEGSIEHTGHTYLVHTPTVVAAATAEAELTPRRRRVFERLGITSFVHLNIAPASPPASTMES